MKQGRPETPPHIERRGQPGRVRALVLAVLVHAAFFALIVFGVTWQVRPTSPVQAELVASLPPIQKPEPAKAEPTPPEPPKPEPPKPEPPKPEPPKPEPPKPEPPKPDPEIALKAEREKKEREKKERLEQEKREKLERAQKEEARKKKEQEEAKKKREQEEAAKKKREQEELAKKKRAEDEARKEKARAEEAAASARQAEFNRYVDAIKAKVRGRANVPDTVTGQPELVARIRILPGGEVLDIQIVRRSGNPAYDAAIERAIRSASPLPVPPANSELFHQFRELNLQFKHER